MDEPYQAKGGRAKHHNNARNRKEANQSQRTNDAKRSKREPEAAAASVAEDRDKVSYFGIVRPLPSSILLFVRIFSHPRRSAKSTFFAVDACRSWHKSNIVNKALF